MYLAHSGDIILESELKLGLIDGVTYGYSVYEKLMILHSKPIFLKEHFKKFKNSCDILKIHFEYTIEEVEKQIHELLDKMKLVHGGIKLMILKKGTDSEFLIIPLENPYKKEEYERGFKVAISSFKRNPYSLITEMKTTNAIERIYSLHGARDEGYDEVLFFNTSNYITEGAISNLFFFKGATIYTPAKDCGIYQGVIREKVIELASRRYEIKEGFFNLSDIEGADEVFLTSSLLGLMPVSRVGKKNFNVRGYRATKYIIGELASILEDEIRD